MCDIINDKCKICKHLYKLQISLQSETASTCASSLKVSSRKLCETALPHCVTADSQRPSICPKIGTVVTGDITRLVLGGLRQCDARWTTGLSTRQTTVSAERRCTIGPLSAEIRPCDSTSTRPLLVMDAIED